jgi:hypothetical protein
MFTLATPAAAAAAAAAADDNSSSGTDVDEPLHCDCEFPDSDDEPILPNSPIAQDPVCAQCADRDLVWSIVVQCNQELVDSLAELATAASRPRDEDSDDDDDLIVHMMARAEIDGARLSTFQRTVNMDVVQMRTALGLFKHAFQSHAWQRIDIEFLMRRYNAMAAEVSAMTSIAPARALYNKTLLKDLSVINQSFVAMNARPGSQSHHDSELLFRARVAVILLTYSGALEQLELRTFFTRRVPNLITAIQSLESRLRQESACNHALE